jgi:ribonuclease P protein component
MERLKRRTDFRAASAGARAPASAFVLQARRRAEPGQELGPETGPARVGFTVSKQVGNSVVRNRVRRRLREVVRLGPGSELCTALCAGHDYVLIGRRAALKASFGDMVREFDAALHRVHAAEPGQRGGTGAAKAGSGDGRPLHEAQAQSRPRQKRPHRQTRQPRHEN